MKDGKFDLREHFKKKINKIEQSFTEEEKEALDKERKELEELIFTDQLIGIDGNTFRVPRCQGCLKPMTPAVDNMNNRLSGYMWKCDCPLGKKYTLGIG